MEPTKLSQALIGPTQHPGPHLRLWQLWLDGHQVSVREDCIEAIDEARKAIRLQKGVDILGVVEALIGQIGVPARGSLAARIFDNIRKESNRISLLIWMGHVALGKKPPVGWNSQVDNLPYGPQTSRYKTIGELFTRAFDVPMRWARTAPLRTWISLDALRRSLVEATEDEWQQAREDCRTIANAIAAWARIEAIYKLCERKIIDGPLPKSTSHRDIEALGKAVKLVPLAMIVGLYRQRFVRAATAGFLIRARRLRLKGNVEEVMASLRNLAATVEAVDREADAVLQSA